MDSQMLDKGSHISQQFNLELEEVKTRMLEMGGRVEKQLSDAVQAVLQGDSRLGEQVIAADDEIDQLEVTIDEECNLILARRQPAARDLRLVLAIIKTVRDLERIGDESAKIAHMAVKLSEQGEPGAGLVEFRHISEQVLKMVNLSLDAFARYDTAAALNIARQDASVDQEYGTAIRSLATYMMEDPRSITNILNVLWALRALERVGDHAKNVSEHVIYLVKGLDVRHEKLEDVERQLNKV